MEMCGGLVAGAICPDLFSSLRFAGFLMVLLSAFGISHGETVELNCSSNMNLMKRNNKAISAGHPLRTKMSKSPKSMIESREQLCSEMERKGQIADESIVVCSSLKFAYYDVEVGGKRDTMFSGALHMLEHGSS
ncbi:hypothetical protein RHMOL_Rhmol10G0153700 [Rhododendron molle]|uniref:Uncharacterized protein n=1 Tax=Rhododendron molle TaxID=49168 RepID=A0ACC0M2V6_RHOML|nr:hypothetical protein RHMOL_Rhmol10G0153700 [Rhododendron molle]